jgi:hypothetical protein
MAAVIKNKNFFNGQLLGFFCFFLIYFTFNLNVGFSQPGHRSCETSETTEPI